MKTGLSRRSLLRLSAAGGTTLAVCSQLTGQGQAWGQSVAEQTATENLSGTFDVIVCGGGPAGVSAAITAARAGARVHLVEAHGCLGGVWTSGMLSYVIDSKSNGFNNELIRRLDKLGARQASGLSNYVYDVESMKFVLESLVTESAISAQIHTRVVDVEKSAAGRVTGVVTESKSGRQLWRAAIVIDTTGDGDVAALANCDFEIGQDAGETGCPCQPMSLMGVITAPPETLAEFNTLVSQENKDRLLAELKRAGVTPSYTKPTLWHLGGAVASVMLNHEYAVRPDNAAEITQATFRARAELFQMARALKQLGGRWTGTALVTTAEQIGIRDGRRVKGRDIVGVEDVVAGRERSDAICTSTFCVDVHGLTKDGPAYGNAGVRGKPFDIPLGALVASDVDGLMIAGRCLSGDFFAHASYRVTGNAIATGEAAGLTAAMAASDQVLPHEVPALDVTSRLAVIRNENR